MKTLKKRGILGFAVWALFGVLLFLFLKIVPEVSANFFYFSVFAFFILFFPGWSISKILNFTNQEFVGQWLLNFVLSLSFYFLINLLAIFLNIDINSLLKIYYCLLPLLWGVALIKDLLRPVMPTANHFEIKKIFKIENIFYLLPLVVGAYIVLVLRLKGPDFNGDPYFHLAIIRKAIDGSFLSSANLAFTKTSLTNPAYIFPVWHVLLALISKVLALDILACWANMILVLSVISFFVWYLLAKIIFKEKAWAILVVLLMMIFSFYSGPGYFFARLTVPDTFSQFVLLPLGLALTFSYIFSKEKRWQEAIVVVISAILLLLVHPPHYFYLLLTVLMLAVLYLIFRYKDIDYKQMVQKIFWVLGFILIPLILLIILIEVSLGSFFTILSEFTRAPIVNISYDKFSKFPLTYQYGYFLLPFVFLFLKNKRIIIILALMLLVPVVYFTPLRDLFSKYLSIVFTDRLLANTSLYFLVFALITGCVLRLIDGFLDRFSMRIKKYLNWTLLILFGAIIIIGLSTEAVSNFTYEIFYSKVTHSLVSQYTLVIFIVSIVVALLFWVFGKDSWSKKNPYEISSYKNNLTVFIFMALLVFVLINPSVKNAKKYFFNNLAYENKTKNFFTKNFQNTDEAINFVKFQIPAKSVFLSDNESAKTLAVMTDQYMAYNIGSAWDKKLNLILSPNSSDLVKDELVVSSQYAIDYVLVKNSKIQDDEYFTKNPLFEKVYDNNIKIYKVIK
ncbi:MAG: DUF6541 family protein [Patescibacteria group bacterium]